MMLVLSFLMGNPLGRTLAKYSLVAIGLLLIIWAIYRKGQNDLKVSQALATVNALKERINVDSEIRSMSVSDRARALKRWVR